MALDSTTTEKVVNLVKAVDAVGTLLPKLHYLKKTLLPADYTTYINAVSEGKEAIVQTEIITKTYQSSSYIDPFTAYSIFDQIIYPTIEAMSPGWSENPYNTDNAQSATRDYYMRGVPLVEVTQASGGKLSSTAANPFIITDLTSGVAFVDNPGILSQKKVTEEYQSLQDQYNNKQSSKDLQTQKDLLLALFGSAYMAKTYFVKNYFAHNDGVGIIDLQEPYRMIQVDPYLAYLTMLFAWLGGVGYAGVAALDRFTGKSGKTLRAAIKGSPFTNNGINWHIMSETNRSKTPQLAIEMLQIFYEYINSAAIKDKNKELYTNWMNMLVEHRKCMVNMLVIINERVNLNNSSTFTFQEKPKAYLLALSIAYKTFSMEIGE